MIARWIRRLLGDTGRPSYSPRRLVAVVTLDLHDTGEIAIPIQRGAGVHRLPRGATSVSMGERR